MTADGVERLLGAPELARLVDALARRIALGRTLSGRITVTAHAGERAAIAALFGRRPGSGTTISADLDRLDAIVRNSGVADSLVDAVEQLRGPIVVEREQVEALRRAWDVAYEPLDSLVATRPELAGWVTGLRSRGAVRRYVDTPDEGTRLLRQVALVLSALPVDGEARPRLAARLLGSAHALDVGTATASLVLSALAVLHGTPVAGQGRRGAQERRKLWASAGVAIDELSSTVLVHRLALPGPAGDLTRAGEPVILTLRQVHGLEVPVPRAPVFICENPSVVDAAARELGDACPPLVCIQGQPSLAADALLRRLAGAGLRYHGDFDWGGLRIANRVYEMFGFEPWRFQTVDLERYADIPGAALKGTRVHAKWDAYLMPALEGRATRLEEEQVLDVLLADLSVA
jgi:uncharacterized protein (TIGR02679 family)